MATPKKHTDLCDRTEFVLDAKQWERFIELLDRPGRVKRELRRLLSEPSIFSDP